MARAVSTTETVDELGHQAKVSAHHAALEEPGLRLLYHPQLARIGARAAASVRGQVVGRAEPRFTDGGIDDPTVSREQLRVRWQVERASFAVEPIASARRAMTAITVGGAVTPLDGPVELAPGAAIAIGERVLIGLELGRVRPPGTDRLGLVGDSEAMWLLREEIRAAALFARPVLVHGPTGAGKELVARAIHASGPRASGPFVAVNCGALAEHLIESTLFGHVRGAFTGAVRDEPGLFAAADGGTLFLDEIGELPRAVQPRLLRVLQEREVVAVGATRGRPVELRVVAATHRALEADVAAGRLREDLYHRLAGHVLRVPPLAARRFDVPALFVHFLRRLVGEHPELAWLLGGDPERPGVPLSFVLALLARPWTGNVRELENVVEQTARQNLGRSRFRAPDELAAEAASAASGAAHAASHASAASAAGAGAASDPALAVIAEALALAPKTVAKLLDRAHLDALRAADRERMREVAAGALYALLDAHDFNQSRVAAVLGTSRTTVVKLIADLALPRAADLDRDTIEAARARAHGDLDAAARALRVSPHALKKRLTLLNLTGRRPARD